MANHESSFEWSVAEQLQRRSAMKLLALLACAACTAPIEATVEQPGTMLIHDTPWFRIHFYEAPHEEAPLPNCPVPIDTRCYASVTGAHLGDIPDYIEDLGVFLEEGLASYRTQGYDLPQSGQIPIYVHLVDEGAGTISFADGGINIDHAMPTMGAWTLPQTLRYTAWHELFHVAQFRAFEGAPPWTHYDSAGRHLWLLEATATDRAFAGAYVPGVFDDADPAFMLRAPLVVEAGVAHDSSYAAFAFFRYVRQRYGIDLTHRWFNAASPKFTLAQVSPTDPIEAFLFDDLSTLMSLEARRDLFRTFGLAYQFTRDTALIPGIREWLGVRRGHVHELTGYERVDPGKLDEPPVALARAVDQVPFTILERGRVVTYAAGFTNVLCTDGPGCNVDAIPVPEQAKIQLNIAATHAGIPSYGAAWRVPASGQPVLLDTFAGSEAERTLEYPLSTFSRTDRLAVTVVADPEQPTSTLGGVRVYAAFDDACRSKTIVVDHTDSQVGYYGGAGKLIVTEKGCKTMLVKIWGGGGPLKNWLLGGAVRNGNGGGGAFVAARVPIDPAGESLRATVPFSGLTGTPTGFPSFVYEPATPPALPSIIAIAGAGGGGGQGFLWEPVAPPHAGGAHEDAPTAIWTQGPNTIVLGGGTAGPGIGGPNNSPYGDGRPFTTDNITGYTWESGGNGPCEAGGGGAGWFGGGGGGHAGQFCGGLGSGGGGGSSYAITSRLHLPVVSTKVGGALRTPGNVDDPDRMTPLPPANACQEGSANPGDPGRGRLGTHSAWCDNPGRIVIKFGKAAIADTNVAR